MDISLTLNAEEDHARGTASALAHGDGGPDSYFGMMSYWIDRRLIAKSMPLCK